MKIISVDSLSFNYDDKKPTDVLSQLKLKVLGSKELLLKHSVTGGVGSIQLKDSKGFLSLDSKTKDVVIGRVFEFPSLRAKLNVVQTLPESLFYLIPSPLFRLSVRPVWNNRMGWEVSKQYDFLERKGLTETEAFLSLGMCRLSIKTDDSKLLHGAQTQLVFTPPKAVSTCSTGGCETGSKGKLASSLPAPLSSASVTYSQDKGLRLLLKASPLLDGLIEAEAEIAQRTQDAVVVVTAKPSKWVKEGILGAMGVTATGKFNRQGYVNGKIGLSMALA
uniref:Uncharacterized protein n=1 Tax=Polytomella parva TaxID=51329 RepID=A0A7S0URW2_9CHLO|mmetsp:Transcript_19199/g.34741  ORF Transcript_19199/g.34741 Transcript_19199/m.34741 type:complete len:277 (+) Transcript_19199:39-869(+)|eukprot:CAMPEP_0175083960 /NCGR_PEP_ID=MMETSP0052_2-20121109/27727_1 /TAXON_ID=51329 ORGANISM="Polytomella parva, Strain SAG 63-3" /NCGR_SAMPLE_ID=MMETSP0052_2 /ASSEMBLY_ACC=CAM_ASM_000194 /LENGTH=276 /DNA_ID=CAMNT_0016355577 /DNA_START=23 /DNA_END=853 /DNA_ORIENTATION=-